jgi:dephospho-CoA kinase
MEIERKAQMTPALGLTGGTGTGKSTVAGLFARRGALVLDADRIGHEVLATDIEVREMLRRTFGVRVFGEDGLPDRRLLGALVFSDAAALAQLNEIVHPPLLTRLGALLKGARENPSLPLVLVDAALIVEWEIIGWFDAIAVVRSSRHNVATRLAAKGIAAEDIARRIGAQVGDEERLRHAQFVLENDGDVARLERGVDTIWQKIARHLSSSPD